MSDELEMMRNIYQELQAILEKLNEIHKAVMK